VLCYTNKKVDYYNNLINPSGKVEVGSIITANYTCENTYIGTQKDRVINIYTSTDYKVEKIFKNELLLDHGFYIKTVTDHARHAEKLAKHVDKKDWQSYYSLYNSYNSFKDIMYNGKRIAKANFNFGRSSTVHKAQGSTYDDVFIDLADISKCRAKDSFRRLLYVALSRAKNNIYIVNE